MRFNKAQLAAVLAAASKDETRYNLNGVLFESERLVATDGHRLHMVDGDKTTQETPVIIAYESCKRILQAMGAKDTAEIVCLSEGTIRDSSATVHISPTGIEIACETIVGTFPDYSKVVPEPDDTKRRFIVSARYLKELCDAAIKAEAMSKNSCAPIQFEIGDDLCAIRVDGQAEHTFTGVVMPQTVKG